MCVDIFAVGHAITVEFIHEQLWLNPAHRKLTVDVVADAFIRNQSDRSIERLRIQFPHFLRTSDVEVLSNPDQLPKNTNNLRDQYSWIGDFKLNRAAEELTLCLKFVDPALEVDSQTLAGLTGHFLYGAFSPSGIAPSEMSTTFIEAMRSVDLISLDLILDKPLAPGKVGWIRLKLSPSTWPKYSDCIPLPGLELIDDNYRFKAQFRIVSPVHLRAEIQEALRNNNECGDVVVNQGWRYQTTLGRIVDHRISVIAPEHVEVGQVVSLPDSSIIAIGPIRSKLVQNQYLIHFATGSNLNRRRDVVLMAEKVCAYCEYLEETSEAPTLEHLVTRCGGSEHESVGTLINEMLKARLLREVDGRICSAKGDDKSLHLTDLRRRYTFPAESIPFLQGMRELHPFSISLTVKWTNFTPEQTKSVQFLRNLVSALGSVSSDGLRGLEPLLEGLVGLIREPAGYKRLNRRAVIVACSDYSALNEPSYPQIDSIAADLCDAVQNCGCVDSATRCLNPADENEILRALNAEASQLRAGGVLVLWYLGHARPSETLAELQLVPTGTASGALSWSTLVATLNRFEQLQKVVVLDCPYGGLITDAMIPGRCSVWRTTDAAEPARLEVIEEPFPKDKHCNFTAAVTRELGAKSEGKNLAQLFEVAQAFVDKPATPACLEAPDSCGLNRIAARPLEKLEMTVESALEALRSWMKVE